MNIHIRKIRQLKQKLNAKERYFNSEHLWYFTGIDVLTDVYMGNLKVIVARITRNWSNYATYSVRRDGKEVFHSFRQFSFIRLYTENRSAGLSVDVSHIKTTIAELPPQYDDYSYTKKNDGLYYNFFLGDVINCTDNLKLKIGEYLNES